MNAEAQQLFWRKPYMLLFIVAGVCLFAGCFNRYSAAKTAAFEATEGELVLTEKKEVLKKGRRVLRYDYDVFWEADGQQYVKQLHNQVNFHESGKRTIWVSKDHTEMVLYSPEAIGESAWKDFLAAALAGTAGGILYMFRRKKSA